MNIRYAGVGIICLAVALTVVFTGATVRAAGLGGHGAGFYAAGDAAPVPRFATSWILVRLQSPLANRGPDGSYLPLTGLEALDDLIALRGVHRVDHALPVATRSPKNPEALARYGLDRTYRFHLPRGSDILELVDEFSRVPGVAFAEPDYIDTAAATLPNDPNFAMQWGLDQFSDADIDAPEAWDLSTGNNLVIGILDSGAEGTHPDLAAKLVPGWDFVNDAPDTYPDGTNTHGTHVASIAAAATNNGVGIAGVCWLCKLMPLKVFDAGGSSPTSRTTDAIVWATDRGIRLFNLSGGGTGFDQTRLDGVAYAYDAGAVFVTVSGNGGSLAVKFPGRHLETIATGLTRPDDTLGISSNYGPQVDVVAPGNTILGAVLGGSYDYLSGTSMAAPHVAGLAGLIRSLYPSVGREETRYLVRVGGEDQIGDPGQDTPGFDFYHGWGRLNAHRTLQSTRSAISLRVEGKASTRVWFDDADPLAESWDFVRGDVGSLFEDRYGVALGSVVCVENDSPDADTIGNEDPGIPDPGEGFFYVARPNGAPGAGSFGGSTLNRDRLVPPVTTAPAAVLEVDQPAAYVGSSVGGAGDVNGDGYDDVLVGAVGYDGALADTGAVLVYHGSPSGLEAAYAWLEEGDTASTAFGWSSAGAGDVDHDGYADVIVGEYEADGGAGKAHVYLGSSEGLAASPNWTATGATSDAQFGFRVRSAGDVNGDSFDDVIVGAYLDDDVYTDEGAAYVYMGSPVGVRPFAIWSHYGGQNDARFGVGVGTAGDVDDDGYDDIIVGAPLYDGGNTNEGRVLVFHGSPAGPGAVADWSWESDSSDARLGYSVGTAGDVNDDGYDDVVVGAWYYSGDEPQEGKVFLFLGSASGLAGTPAWSFEHDQGDAQLGISAETAGDVNADGYDDVIVGSNFFDGIRSHDGRAWLFLGSASGLSDTPVWFESGKQPGVEFGWRLGSAGDVNGDGFDDIIIGAPTYDGGEFEEGRAFVYHGPLSRTTSDCGANP